MQPELSPPDNLRVSPWHYVTLLPTLVGMVAVSLSVLAWFGEWGGGTKVATVIAVFFSEFMMVVSAAGLLGYLRQEARGRRRKVIALWNLFLLLLSALCGLYLFFSQ
ncbi:hypothetical protein [Motiliproteus sp. MSK22-1]|uniref:hypothetical protein n=1 Tax=Motiliproteus sp. MSK22-1 TaxID=1897630 RepID=UPI0009765B06|nr:hypothetical protein [Motiliproteus sp. MSK22-1]OMH36252.1 hypothetical protein BGP75_09895 [Motiliproteus sp. MSK22-1]